MGRSMAEVTANRDAGYWIDRLTHPEPLSEVERESLELWFQTPQGKAWIEG